MDWMDDLETPLALLLLFVGWLPVILLLIVVRRWGGAAARLSVARTDANVVRMYVLRWAQGLRSPKPCELRVVTLYPAPQVRAPIATLTEAVEGFVLSAGQDPLEQVLPQGQHATLMAPEGDHHAGAWILCEEPPQSGPGLILEEHFDRLGYAVRLPEEALPALAALLASGLQDYDSPCPMPEEVPFQAVRRLRDLFRFESPRSLPLFTLNHPRARFFISAARTVHRLHRDESERSVGELLAVVPERDDSVAAFVLVARERPGGLYREYRAPVGRGPGALALARWLARHRPDLLQAHVQPDPRSPDGRRTAAPLPPAGGA